MRRVLLAGLCLIAVSAPARAQSEAEKRGTVAYLQKLQTKGGGFLPAATAKQATLRATTSALRALKYFGGDVPDRGTCTDFVRSCFVKAAGGFADRPGGQPDVTNTAVGLMALIELQMRSEDRINAATAYLAANARSSEEIRLTAAALEAVGKRPRQADAWLSQVMHERNPDGTFGKGDGVARATGGATVLILRLGGELDGAKAVVAALDRGQRSDGGFGKEEALQGDLESTYRVMRCYHMLRVRPKAADRCIAFIARCRNEDGGYGVSPGQPSSAAGTYYAGIVLHWLH